MSDTGGALPRLALAGPRRAKLALRGLGSFAPGLALDTKNLDVIQARPRESKVRHIRFAGLCGRSV
jgi:hypothetical protein